MDGIDSLHSFETIKVLADARRLEILRLLMSSPATLTKLAKVVKRSPAWVRHHLKALEAAGLIQMVEIRTTGKVTEKYYRADAEAILLREIVLPKTRKPAMLFAGSHDLALEGIAKHFEQQFAILTLPVGSLEGLLDLRQGLCQVAGAHLLDASGEYNIPYMRHLFPERNVELVTLAHRRQGLMVKAGNPRGLKRISDLTRADVRFVNRNAGSGTRLWLDMALERAHISPQAVRGYGRELKTHTEAAISVATDTADVALGLQAAAVQHGLDFIPLFEERYDLILLKDRPAALDPVLDYIQTAAFRRETSLLSGYSTVHSGEQIPI